MSIGAAYLDIAQAELERITTEFRPRLLEAYGVISAELKDDKTPVTQLDREIEERIRDSLRKIDPAIGLVGEEFGAEGDKNTTWYIDPIDGTEQFIRGIPAFRTMATLVHDGEIQFTFVCETVQNEIYAARRGEGAYCNGERLIISDRPLDRAMVEMTGSYDLPVFGSMMALVRRLTRGPRISGEFTNTPRGRFEGHLFYKGSGSTWDWTPWALLIKEAGGKIANFGSDSYDYKNGDFLAAAPAVFDELKPALDDFLDRGGL